MWWGVRAGTADGRLLQRARSIARARVYRVGGERVSFEPVVVAVARSQSPRSEHGLFAVFGAVLLLEHVSVAAAVAVSECVVLWHWFVDEAFVPLLWLAASGALLGARLEAVLLEDARAGCPKHSENFKNLD